MCFLRARHIALYLPADGEISPLPLSRLALALGKHCYLPSIRDEELVFMSYEPGQTTLRENRFGLMEPQISPRNSRNPWLLDLVLVPLVGFDPRGYRMGMGKGYYDRCFGPLSRRWHRPKLMGLAHSVQQTELEPDPWDVPLDLIATEKQLTRC